MTKPATQLTPQQVKELIDAGEAYLIDVREAIEYAQVHIEGAHLAPLSTFDPATIRPPADRQLVIHCRSGQRCGVATQALRAAGYTDPVNRMTGGLLAWIEAGLPVV